MVRSHQIGSSAGVQQNDTLSPLLFSLALSDLIDDVGQIPGAEIQLW